MIPPFGRDDRVEAERHRLKSFLVNAVCFGKSREAKKRETTFRRAFARNGERASSQAALHGCLPADQLRLTLGQSGTHQRQTRCVA